MAKKEEELIADILNIAHLTKLPGKMNPEEFIWIEAIAKLRLTDGNIGYGIIKRTPDLNYTFTHVNGATAAIRNVEEVYPYINIDKRHIKKFTDKEGRESRIEYLQSLNLPYADKIDFENATIADLNKEVVKAAVYQQLNALEE